MAYPPLANPTAVKELTTMLLQIDDRQRESPDATKTDRRSSLFSRCSMRCDDLLVALLAHLVQVPPRQDGPLSEEEHSLAMDFHAALQRGMTRRFHHEWDDMLQTVVEDNCWDFQDRCDQVYYQGEHGAFLHYCQDLVQETILEEEEDAKEEPAPITTNPRQQVARELQEALTACWES
jgi:hypothetical protein